VTLPTFVPSTPTAELAAEKLWAAVMKKEVERGFSWEDQPAHVRNYWMGLAVDMLHGAGQHLVADAFAHVGEHPEPYGVPGPADGHLTTPKPADDLKVLAGRLRADLYLAT
jgi:hypothetical protein